MRQVPWKPLACRLKQSYCPMFQAGAHGASCDFLHASKGMGAPTHTHSHADQLTNKLAFAKLRSRNHETNRDLHHFRTDMGEKAAAARHPLREALISCWAEAVFGSRAIDVWVRQANGVTVPVAALVMTPCFHRIFNTELPRCLQSRLLRAPSRLLCMASSQMVTH